MNKKIIFGILIILVVALGVYWYFKLQTPSAQLVTSNTPTSTSNSSSTPLESTSTAQNISQSNLVQANGIFWSQDGQPVSNTFNVGTAQAVNIPFDLVSPITSSSNEITYQVGDLQIVSVQGETTLSTKTATSTITKTGGLINELWTFEFNNNQYFLLKGSAIAEYSTGNYFMYQLSGGNLKQISTNKLGQFWSITGKSGYATGQFWGVISIQNTLYVVMKDPDGNGASTIILDGNGNFEKIVQESQAPDYGTPRIYLSALLPSWGFGSSTTSTSGQ